MARERVEAMGRKNDGTYGVVTARIVALLQQGVVPWRRPWTDIGPAKSLHSGREYRGINAFLLAATGSLAGYASPYWITYRQAQESGGHVRKGEKSTPVVFWKMRENQRDADGAESAEQTGDDAEEKAKRNAPLLLYHQVFNVCQCEGVEYPESVVAAKPFDPIAECERIVHAMPRPPTVRHGPGGAYYAPKPDTVAMPFPHQFDAPEEYYATLFHELSHATGHATRLDRAAIRDGSRLGSAAYAREELLAEMGAAFLCARTGIETRTVANAAAYIQDWLRKLEGDARLVVVAASGAQKAADWILGESREDAQRRETTAVAAVARDAARER